MPYYDDEHKNKINEFNELWKGLENIESLARIYSIQDIAQDNNLKLLQTLVLFNFTNQSNREGSDAIDCYGHVWELKTVNIDLTTSFSTNHHTNLERIAAFRTERWLFSTYQGISLREVYAVSPKKLDPYFSKWEDKIKKAILKGVENPHINNPKIPVSFVKSIGIQVYPVKIPVDPAEVLKNI